MEGRASVSLSFEESTPDVWLKRSNDCYAYYLLSGDFDLARGALFWAHQALYGRHDSATTTDRAALALTSLCALGRALLRWFQHEGLEHQITEAINCFRFAYLGRQQIPADNPWRRRCFDYLCVSYRERDGNLDGLRDLDSQALHVDSQSVPNLDTLDAEMTHDELLLGYTRMSDELDAPKFSRGRLEDVEAAIHLNRRALSFLSSTSHEEFVGSILIKLGNLLARRYEVKGILEDINEAVEFCNMALVLLKADPEKYGSSLGDASVIFADHFRASGRREDLDNAIRCGEQGVKILSALGTPEDLDKEEGVNILVSKNPILLQSLTGLSTALWLRFRTAGDSNDLDYIIRILSHAVDVGKSHPSLSVMLHQLSCVFHDRFLYKQVPEDLNESIAAAQKAVELTPSHDPWLVTCLRSLSEQEYGRFQKLLDGERLLQSLQYIQQAWSVSKRHSDLIFVEQHALLHQYGLVLEAVSMYSPRLEGLKSMFQEIQSEDFVDIEEPLNTAIDFARKGASIEHYYEGRVRSYERLSSLLHDRWFKTRQVEDLHEGRSTARRFMELADGVEDVVSAKSCLGFSLLRSFDYGKGDFESLDEAASLLSSAFQMTAAAPFARLQSGRGAVEALAKLGHLEASYELGWQVIELSVVLNARSQGWHERQFWQRQAMFIAEQASVAIELGKHVLDVVDMLETSRVSILGRLIDDHTDLDDLLEAAPEKAKMFQALLNELNDTTDALESTSARAKRGTRRIKAEEELRACLKDIREVDRFHRFLLGPSRDEISAVGAQGPVLIVNVSETRSDAIIIARDASIFLPLPNLAYEKVVQYLSADITTFNFENVGQKNKKLRQLQAWLWDTCVKVIFYKLEDLGYGPAKFHVWWMGIGIAAFLPFHAAGRYGRNATETALSKAISSYTPSLKILLHGRQKLKSHASKSDGGHAASGLELPQPKCPKLERHAAKIRLSVLAMPTTPGMQPLEGVELEGGIISSIVGATYSTEIFVHPSAKDAVDHMAKSEILHFACHGTAVTPDASSSHLCLQAETSTSVSMPAIDKLSIKDVAAVDLKHGKLAFLSACSTAQIRGEDLLDESLHLVAAFQVAGYLHAVGNLWPAGDGDSVVIVKSFYEQLVAAGEFGSGENAALALNEALLDFAKEHAKDPLAWAQFVHFGV